MVTSVCLPLAQTTQTQALSTGTYADTNISVGTNAKVLSSRIYVKDHHHKGCDYISDSVYIIYISGHIYPTTNSNK